MAKKKTLVKYQQDPVTKKLDTNKPIYDEKYDKEEKINYYKKRSTDESLTPSQREYASKKVEMLTSGRGIIAITQDENFKGGKGKKRRVMVSGVNPEDETIMVNPIYSSDNDTRLKLNRQNAPILQNNSYINQECVTKKKKGGAFKKEDIEETTSTIHPFDFKKIFKFLFHNSKTKKNKNISKGNIEKGKKFKKQKN